MALHSKNVLEGLNPKFFELIIFPTEDCNFRCTYCYEDFSIGRMKSSTFDAIKKLISKRIGSLDTLKLNWFGGEPLLCKKMIMELYQFVNNEIKARELNVKILSHFTTNGFYLDNKFVDFVTTFGLCTFQISLDGFGLTHDETRRKANGEGTFEAIWKNLINIKSSSSNYIVSLRLHLTNKNTASLIELANLIKKDLLIDPRFKPYVFKVGNWGGPNSDKIQVLNDKKVVNQSIKTINTILRETIKPTKFNQIKDSYIPVCYASKPNSITIRADGSLGKCTVKLKDSFNNVGKLNSDGSLDIDGKKIKPWLQGYGTGEHTVLKCPANFVQKQHTSKLRENVIKIFEP